MRGFAPAARLSSVVRASGQSEPVPLPGEGGRGGVSAVRAGLQSNTVRLLSLRTLSSHTSEPPPSPLGGGRDHPTPARTVPRSLSMFIGVHLPSILHRSWDYTNGARSATSPTVPDRPPPPPRARSTFGCFPRAEGGWGGKGTGKVRPFLARNSLLRTGEISYFEQIRVFNASGPQGHCFEYASME